MKIKSGFTLAEMMLTVGIIGVLATIMLPAIKNAQPNKELVLVKKSYYNVSRIVGELINDEDFYPERETEADSGFSNVNISDQMGDEATFHGQSYSGNSKFCGLFAAKLNLVQSDSPNSLCTSRVSLDNGGNFETPDGVIWSMPNGSFSSGTEDIYIDVNGKDKGKNCTRDSGISGNGMTLCPNGTAPDRFAFRISRHGSISIPGKLGQLYATTTNVNKSYQEFVRENSGIE